MTALTAHTFLPQLLDLVYAGDCRELLTWHTQPPSRDLTFAISCGDLFVWGGNDEQIVNPGNFRRLKKAFADVRDVDAFAPSFWGAYLWCARERRQRPQPVAYPVLHPALFPLFDLAGPPRGPDTAPDTGPYAWAVSGTVTPESDAA